MSFEKFHSQLDLPFLETNKEYLKEIFQTLAFKFGLQSNSKQKFIDLGAGNGTVVIFIALNHNIKSYGIEIDQNLYNEAKDRIESLKREGNYNKNLLKKIKIHLGNFYLFTLKDYDFIYIYSLPTMQKYLKHVFSTAKNGAIIISHKHKLKELEFLLRYEDKLIHKNDRQNICTYFYKKNA